MTLIGKGECSFWDTKWHNQVIQYDKANPPMQLSISFKDAVTNVNYMEYASQYLSANQYRSATAIVLNPLMQDTLIWKGSNTTKFSSGASWESIRTQHDLVHWYKHVWNSWLPPKIAICMWKLLHNALPVDDNICRLSIPIASQCKCCNPPQCETVDHLFVHGQLAQEVWQYFTSACNMQSDYASIRVLLTNWWRNKSFKTQAGFTKSSIASCVCWELWK